MPCFLHQASTATGSMCLACRASSSSVSSSPTAISSTRCSQSPSEGTKLSSLDPGEFRNHLLKFRVLPCQLVASRRPKILKLESRRHSRPQQGPCASRNQSRTLPVESRNAVLQFHSLIEALTKDEG